MESKVLAVKTPEKAPKKKPKFTQDGKRIIENWCLYAQHLIKKERMKAKKELVVTRITEKDEKIFMDAYKKLRQQRKTSDLERIEKLKRIIKTRSSNRSDKAGNYLKDSAGDGNYVYCQIDYKKNAKPSIEAPKPPKSSSKLAKKKPTTALPTNSKANSQVAKKLSEKMKSDKKLSIIKTPEQSSNKENPLKKLSIKPIVKINSESNLKQTSKAKIRPLKIKKWSPPVPSNIKVKKSKPVIVIPPIKTRPWVPPYLQPAIPRVRPVVEYPPLKMRKVASKPLLAKRKTLKIKIPPFLIRPRKSCSQMKDREFCQSFKRVNLMMKQLERSLSETPGKSFPVNPQVSSTEVGKLSSYSDFNLFTLTNDIRSIRGTEVNTIEENVSMQICYAIATLCISRSLDPEFFTRDIIDKIIIFGNDLMTQCADAWIEDFNLCADEFYWNFELNNVFTNVQMDIFQRGIITTHPGPHPQLMHSLNDFFTFYSVGVLITHSFVVAIWKDDGEFFIFYSTPIDEVGKIPASDEMSSSPTAFPGLVVFKSVSDLYANIHGNLPESAYCKPFELRICNITMTDLCKVADSCVQEAENLCDVEWVLPAIAVPDDFDPKKLAKKKKNEIFDEVLMRKIKAKNSTSPGFIKFDNGSLICGRLSKQSKSLDLHQITKDFHANAIGLASIAMSCHIELKWWCGEVIDKVIKNGNNLYIKSAVDEKSRQVPLKKLISTMIFDGTRVDMTIEHFQDVLMESLVLENLKNVFEELFCCYSYALFTRGKECWALMNPCGKFFLFDSLGIEVKSKGKKLSQHRAVLYKFETLDLMIKKLMEILEDTFDDSSDEPCQLSAIVSCPTRFQQTINEVQSKVASKKRSRLNKKPVKSWRGDDMAIFKDIEPMTMCEEIEEQESDCIVIQEL